MADTLGFVEEVLVDGRFKNLKPSITLLLIVYDIFMTVIVIAYRAVDDKIL